MPLTGLGCLGSLSPRWGSVVRPRAPAGPRGDSDPARARAAVCQGLLGGTDAHTQRLQEGTGQALAWVRPWLPVGGLETIWPRVPPELWETGRTPCPFASRRRDPSLRRPRGLTTLSALHRGRQSLPSSAPAPAPRPLGILGPRAASGRALCCPTTAGGTSATSAPSAVWLPLQGAELQTAPLSGREPQLRPVPGPQASFGDGALGGMGGQFFKVTFASCPLSPLWIRELCGNLQTVANCERKGIK